MVCTQDGVRGGGPTGYSARRRRHAQLPGPLAMLLGQEHPQATLLRQDHHGGTPHVWGNTSKQTLTQALVSIGGTHQNRHWCRSGEHIKTDIGVHRGNTSKQTLVSIGARGPRCMQGLELRYARLFLSFFLFMRRRVYKVHLHHQDRPGCTFSRLCCVTCCPPGVREVYWYT